MPLSAISYAGHLVTAIVGANDGDDRSNACVKARVLIVWMLLRTGDGWRRKWCSASKKCKDAQERRVQQNQYAQRPQKLVVPSLQDPVSMFDPATWGMAFPELFPSLLVRETKMSFLETIQYLLMRDELVYDVPGMESGIRSSKVVIPCFSESLRMSLKFSCTVFGWLVCEAPMWPTGHAKNAKQKWTRRRAVARNRARMVVQRSRKIGWLDRAARQGQWSGLVREFKTAELLLTEVDRRGTAALCFRHRCDVRVATSHKHKQWSGSAASQSTASTQLSLSASQASPAEVRTPQECQFEVVHAKPALIADFDESHRPCVPKILRLEACVLNFDVLTSLHVTDSCALGRQRVLFFLSPVDRATAQAAASCRCRTWTWTWNTRHLEWFYKSRCAARVCDHPCQDHGGGRGEEFADSWCSMDEVRRGHTYFWFPNTFCCGRGHPDIKGFALWYVWRGTALACEDAHQKWRPNHFAGREDISYQDIRSRHLRKGDDSSARNLAGWQDPTCGVQTTGGFDGSGDAIQKVCTSFYWFSDVGVSCWPGFAFLMLSAIKMSVPWLAAQPIATAADLLRRQQKSLRLLWPSDERLFAIDLVDAIPRCCYAGTYSADRHSTCLTRPDCATKKAGASIACNQMKMWLFGIFIDVTYAGCIQTLIQGDCWWH